MNLDAKVVTGFPLKVHVPRAHNAILLPIGYVGESHTDEYLDASYDGVFASISPKLES